MDSIMLMELSMKSRWAFKRSRSELQSW